MRPSLSMPILVLLLAAFLTTIFGWTQEPSSALSSIDNLNSPRKLASSKLPNAIEVRAGLISGGLPESKEAFEELNRLGVKTIISVDGAKPDVETAQRFAMRYVHIPHGYDGISESTLRTLAKAISELPSPIYIHCHHGKHRSPAAAAAACVALGAMQVPEALHVLELAGTSPAYKGLFQAVQRAKRIEPADLENLHADFPSACDVPPLVDAMVSMEETFAQISKVAAAGWKPSPESNKIDVAHESVLLREHFEEMQRLENTAEYPAEFRRLLEDSERAAWFVESMLNPIRNDAIATDSVALRRLKPLQRKAIELNWNAIRSNCTSCHQQFRDPPR